MKVEMGRMKEEKKRRMEYVGWPNKREIGGRGRSLKEEGTKEKDEGS